MRLGFYTYSYTDRLNMPLVPVLEHIASTGYSGIDISGTHGNSADPESVTADFRKLTYRTADRLQLAVEAVITHDDLTASLLTASPLDLKGSVDLAVDVGAPIVTFHMGGPDSKATGIQATWDQVVRYLKEATRYAEARHVKLACDGIWPSWIVDSPEAMMSLFDAVGSPMLGVNFDPCYLVLMQQDPVHVAGLWKERIFHGHVKDHVGHYPDWNHRIPGRGQMDYERVVKGLKKVRFTGSISIEAFTSMDFEEACEIGYRTLSHVMQR